MNQRVKDFYRQISDDHPKGNFKKVIALCEEQDLHFETIQKKAPDLPRGWFELAHLSNSDRIEFSRDFWIAKLPYHPNLQKFISSFFATLDDVQVYLVQQKLSDPFDVHLVYSLKNDEGFYKGLPQALDEDIIQLELDFPEIIFPADYLKFLQIHNGFCKTTDCTGIFSSKLIKLEYEKLGYAFFNQEKETTNTKGEIVNNKSLIPFYESFGMPFYQCFFSDWYPEEEMGNVYYSAMTNTISDVHNKDCGVQAMAFATFSDWLIFYLESID